MLIILYSWKIKPGKEEQFIEAWKEITQYFLEHADSLGSRLHRGDNGLFYAYAQWKSSEDRERAFENSIGLEGAGEKMKDAIEERFPEVILDKIEDFLIMP